MNLPRGTLVLVGLSPTVGHEQRGSRPGVIVSDSGLSAGQRFPMMCIVPVSGVAGQGDLYPALAAGRGLRKQSFALVDQLRAIDKRRVHRVLGRVDDMELAAIDKGLRLYLGLSGA